MPRLFVVAAVTLMPLALVPNFLRFVARWREYQLGSGYRGATPVRFVLRAACHLMPSLVADLVGLSQLLAERRIEGIFPASYALLGPFILTMTAALHVNVSAKYVAFTLPAFCIAAAYFLGKLGALPKGK